MSLHYDVKLFWSLSRNLVARWTNLFRLLTIRKPQLPAALKWCVVEVTSLDFPDLGDCLGRVPSSIAFSVNDLVYTLFGCRVILAKPIPVSIVKIGPNLIKC